MAELSPQQNSRATWLAFTKTTTEAKQGGLPGTLRAGAGDGGFCRSATCWPGQCRRECSNEPAACDRRGWRRRGTRRPRRINARQNREIVVAESRRFNYGEAPAATTQPTSNSGFKVESKTPLRGSRVESEVIVPLLITLITAVIVALGLGVAAWRYDWSLDVPLWGFVGVLGIVWGWRLIPL